MCHSCESEDRSVILAIRPVLYEIPAQQYQRIVHPTQPMDEDSLQSKAAIAGLLAPRAQKEMLPKKLQALLRRAEAFYDEKKASETAAQKRIEKQTMKAEASWRRKGLAYFQPKEERMHMYKEEFLVSWGDAMDDMPDHMQIQQFSAQLDGIIACDIDVDAYQNLYDGGFNLSIVYTADNNRLKLGGWSWDFGAYHPTCDRCGQLTDLDLLTIAVSGTPKIEISVHVDGCTFCKDIVTAIFELHTVENGPDARSALRRSAPRLPFPPV
jgi:hypothetical protein